MRGSLSKQQNQIQDKQHRIAQESDLIMKRIEQLKEEMSPMSSQPKMGSENRERWNQYLPAEHLQSFASVSQKEEYKLDHYRNSLEQRLEKLFKEEKDLLKERHFGHSFGRSQGQLAESAKVVLG
jgi:hypothetical protein